MASFWKVSMKFLHVLARHPTSIRPLKTQSTRNSAMGEKPARRPRGRCWPGSFDAAHCPLVVCCALLPGTPSTEMWRMWPAARRYSPTDLFASRQGGHSGRPTLSRQPTMACSTVDATGPGCRTR